MQIEYFGPNSIENLETILQKEQSRRVFLIINKTAYEKSGAKQKIEKALSNQHCQYTKFSDFSPNPKFQEIQQGSNQFQQQAYDTIVALGGGSTIDVAKAIKLYQSPTTPLIAIPTTTGSGSEATHFIVYYIGKEKQSKGDPDITLPNYVILDSCLTESLPSHIVASTGADALAQAIESYWSVNSTDQSKSFAQRAITLLTENLEQAVNRPSNNSRENMLLAANLAGKAINLTKTTACHSIAYPITSHFQVPHGHAAALTLGEMLVYNSQITEQDCNDQRGSEYVQQTTQQLINLLKTETPEQASQKITQLLESVGLKTSLRELQISKQEIEMIIEKGFNPQRVKNNPRQLTEQGLRKILTKIY